MAVRRCQIPVRRSVARGWLRRFAGGGRIRGWGRDPGGAGGCSCRLDGRSGCLDRKSLLFGDDVVELGDAADNVGVGGEELSAGLVGGLERSGVADEPVFLDAELFVVGSDGLLPNVSAWVRFMALVCSARRPRWRAHSPR